MNGLAIPVLFQKSPLFGVIFTARTSDKEQLILENDDIKAAVLCRSCKATKSLLSTPKSGDKLIGGF